MVEIMTLDATLAAFTAAKVAGTQQLTALVAKKNSGQIVTNADLTTLVVLFNTMTLRSNEMRVVAANTKISIENLSDEDVETMKEDPGQYFTAGYLTLTNSLLFYGREHGLLIADMVHADLRRDINDAFDDQAAGVVRETPRTSIVFESDHALAMVEAHLEENRLPDEEGATP